MTPSSLFWNRIAFPPILFLDLKLFHIPSLYGIIEAMIDWRFFKKLRNHTLLGLLVGTMTVGSISTAFADDIYQQEDVMKIASDAGLNFDNFYKPKADIVIDANTGAILYGDNIDTVRDSGSMAKLMSAYVVFRAIKEGKITYDTVVTATEADQAISENNLLSNSPIVAGVRYKVSELLKMLFVPSSSAAVIMLANLVTDNDPDKFLELMNQYSQEMGMVHTKWNNPNGAMISVLQGYYNPQHHDLNANNEITARDMSILAYHIVNDLPEMLEYTKQAHTTIMPGTPYEQSYDNYNTSLEGGKFELKGTDGLKTGSSPTADYNYTATTKRGKQRIIEVILGVGNYDVEIAESYRNQIGNALAEKMFADYQYKKVLSAGDHEIDGQTVHLEKDFYATVKKGTNPAIKLENKRLVVQNGLKQVSPSIKPGIAISDSQPTNSSSKKRGFDIMWIFCFLPAGILYLIFKQTDPNRRK